MVSLMRKYRFSLSIAALLTFAVGLLISMILFTSLRRMAHDNIDTEFEQRAKVRVAAIQHGFGSSINVLQDVNQLFTSFGEVGREQFHLFATPLLERNPSLRSLNYHRLITDEERVRYEAEMHKTFPEFTIREWRNGQLVTAGQRDTYRVVEYVEPLHGNEDVFGLDAGARDFQRDAMQRAVDTGKPSATGLFLLVQEREGQKGFVVLMPVYRPGASLENISARRQAIVGATTAVFRSHDMIHHALSTDQPLVANDKRESVNISVYASPLPQPESLIFGDGVLRSSVPTMFGLPGWLLYDQPADHVRTFDVAGNTWSVVVSAMPQLFVARHSNALWVLLAGIAFSFGAAVYLQTIVTRSRRIQMLVDERTMQLRTANQELVADIAARRYAEQELQLRERAIEASANAIIITNAEGPVCGIEYVNPAFERITGYSLEDVIGRNISLLWGSDLEQTGIEEIRSCIQEQREGHAVLRSYRKDATLLWSDMYVAPVRDDYGRVSHYVIAQYDITATKRYESELEFQTNRDALTGLANRSLLRDRLSQAISYAHRYSHPIWVLFIDLDRFKFVNDTLGHQAGDFLLKTMASRIQHAVRDTDTIARMGGDEFVLVLPERMDTGLSTGIVRRIMDAIAEPLIIEGHEFFISSSIGVAVYPADGVTPETLIKHADIAMYRAKETGRNNFQFYTSEMNERALERLQIEGDLRMAIERREFELHYQPQVDLATGKIVGVEALIRWRHPELGMIAPARFISMAEETGLIIPIGNWVIREACRQGKVWLDAGFAGLRTAVNLSARQFARQDLVQSIAEALKASGLSPASLEIELTESLVMADVEHATGILRELKTLGVHLSIDDFGTGYSSLSYLKRFPIDVLKIDRSFVSDITHDPDDAAIVTSIISLAHSLRLLVIAEGVETAEQLGYLRQHGCDQMQGYLFSPPVSADVLMQMLQEDRQLSQGGGLLA